MHQCAVFIPNGVREVNCGIIVHQFIHRSITATVTFYFVFSSPTPTLSRGGGGWDNGRWAGARKRRQRGWKGVGGWG